MNWKQFSVAVVLTAGASSSPTFAFDEGITRVTSVAQDVFIKGYVWANSKCEMVEAPPIYIDRPPKHGIICSIVGPLWVDAKVTRQGSNCSGRKVSGTHVIYLPKAGYTGHDDVHYVVKFPSEDHGVWVSIDVVRAKPGLPPPVPRDISAPRGDKPQLPGALMSCSALVS